MDSRPEWSETKPATEETQKISDEVKLQVEEKTGKTYKEFIAAVYREVDLCGGTHYLIKVQVEENKYIHLQLGRIITREMKKMLCKDMPIDLIAWQENHTRDDPLEPIKPINQ